MRDVGKTSDGEFLVALTPKEFRTLQGLVDSISGDMDFNYMLPDGFGRHEEMDEAFKAIRLWVICRFKINGMQDLLDEYRKVLGDT